MRASGTIPDESFPDHHAPLRRGVQLRRPRGPARNYSLQGLRCQPPLPRSYPNGQNSRVEHRGHKGCCRRLLVQQRPAFQGKRQGRSRTIPQPRPQALPHHLSALHGQRFEQNQLEPHGEARRPRIHRPYGRDFGRDFPSLANDKLQRLCLQ